MTAVEWLAEKFYANEGIMKSVWLELAKEMENDQIYSEEEVREMLFMALNETQDECCTTHTKDSIVRKVLKTFK